LWIGTKAAGARGERKPESDARRGGPARPSGDMQMHGEAGKRQHTHPRPRATDESERDGLLAALDPWRPPRAEVADSENAGFHRATTPASDPSFISFVPGDCLALPSPVEPARELAPRPRVLSTSPPPGSGVAGAPPPRARGAGRATCIGAARGA
jgi:hypothetical protein